MSIANKKDNRPRRAYREITFDRKLIKETIQPLNYYEARRIKGPIYEALHDELYHAGCLMLPEFLLCLAEKETSLYESVSIRERITDAPYRNLFYTMIDYLKKAELAVVKYKDQGYRECFTLFYNTVKLLEPYKTQFEYVLTTVIEKLISICKNVEGQERDSTEIITRIYIMYANYLEGNGDKSGAITFLEKALHLVRGHIWLAEDKVQLLHEVIARKLAAVQLDYGHQILRNHPDLAIELTRKATMVTAEIGRENNLQLFCKTFLARAYFLMDSGDPTAAKHVLERIKPEVMKRSDYSFIKVNIQFYAYMGQCNDIFEHYETAITNYRRALRLCQIYNHRQLEAETLLNLGKIYAKDTQKTNVAKKCYEAAKRIYIEHNDIASKKKAGYLLAKLKADEITPLYLAMLKCSQTQYCAFYNLRQWKNWCRPFWIGLGKEIVRQEKDPIYCLLDEENYQQFKKLGEASES